MDQDIFNFLSRYFWLIGIVLAVINTLIMRYQLQPRMQESPNHAPGYVHLLWGYWAFLTLPWIPMGIGILWGNIPTVWYFLFPSSGNPYVLAWWVTYWLELGLMSYWILFGGGAEMLIAYPGFLRGNITRPLWLKGFWLLTLAGSVAFTIIMLDQPLPKIYDIPGF